MEKIEDLENKMKLGYFTQPFHPTSKILSQSLREDYEAAIIADRNGYSEAIFGEHATDAYETITSSLTFISSLCYNTNNIYVPNDNIYCTGLNENSNVDDCSSIQTSSACTGTNYNTGLCEYNESGGEGEDGGEGEGRCNNSDGEADDNC